MADPYGQGGVPSPSVPPTQYGGAAQPNDPYQAGQPPVQQQQYYPTPGQGGVPQPGQPGQAYQAYGQLPAANQPVIPGQDQGAGQYAPEQSAAYPNTPQYSAPSRKPGKRLVMVVLAVVGLGILVGGGAFAYIATRPTPDSVFRDAVANSLSTRQVKQIMTTESLGSQEITYDLSGEKDPRVYAHAKINLFDTPIDAEQYASLKNSYVKLNEAGDMFTGNTPLASYKGKWMQDRKDGKNVANAEDSLSVVSILPPGYTYLFGDWIFGSFSAKDKQDLQNFIVGQKVFGYDAKSVVKKRLGNEDVFVYQVTDNTSKKTEMNKKVAAVWGMDPSEVENALATQQQTDKATLYISIKTKRLVEVDAESNNIKVVNKYTNYDTLTITPQPSAQADYATFLRLSDMSSSGTSSSTSSGAPSNIQ